MMVILSNVDGCLSASVNGVRVSSQRVTPMHPFKLEVVRCGDSLLMYSTGLVHPIVIHAFSHAKTTDCGAPPARA